MRKFVFSFVVAAAGLSGTVGGATPFNLTLQLADGSVLKAEVDGVVQSDGVSVFVNGISGIQLDGSLAPDLGFVSSATAYAGGTTAPGILSTDNSIANFVACDSSACLSGFSLVGGGGVPVTFIASGDFGGTGTQPGDFSTETLASGQPSLTLPSVPLPAAGAMLLAGLGALGLFRRKRSA